MLVAQILNLQCCNVVNGTVQYGTHLVLSGMPILKHCSWISAMHLRGAEVVEGGAMSDG